MALDLDEIDEAFPVLVRYIGLISMVVLFGACLAGYWEQAAPGFVPATSMLVYKNWHDAAKRLRKDTRGDDDDGA